MSSPTSLEIIGAKCIWSPATFTTGGYFLLGTVGSLQCSSVAPSEGGKGKASPLWVYGKIGKQLPNPTNSLCTAVNVSASGGLRTLDPLLMPHFPPLLQNPGGATGAPYTPTSLTPAGEALLCNWVTQLLLDYWNVFWYLNTKQTVPLTRVKSCSHNRFLAANQQTDIHWLLAVYIFIKLNY